MSIYDSIKKVLDSIQATIDSWKQPVEVPELPPNQPVVTTLPTKAPSMNITNEMVYQSAKAHMVPPRRLTLDPSVPAELGCAEAVSFILRDAGLSIPNGGIAGTAALGAWIRSSGLFVKSSTPKLGSIVLCETGTSSKNDPHGHVGIMVDNNQIVSNDSDTGLFVTKYSLTSWLRYFSTALGFPTTYWDLK